jgi:hypothetical protein
MEFSISFYQGYGNSRFSFKGSMDVAGHGRPLPIAAMLRHTQAGEIGAARVRQRQFV